MIKLSKLEKANLSKYITKIPNWRKRQEFMFRNINIAVPVDRDFFKNSDELVQQIIEQTIKAGGVYSMVTPSEDFYDFIKINYSDYNFLITNFYIKGFDFHFLISMETKHEKKKGTINIGTL